MKRILSKTVAKTATNTTAKLLAVAVAISAAQVASAASSVSGTTDFRVKMPEILVLYHWDDALLDLTAANKVINDATTRSTSSAVGGSSYSIGTSVSTTAPTALNLNTVDVTLQNAWAVRSISSGSVSLALANPNSTLTKVGGTATMTTSLPKLTSTATGVSGSGTATVTLPSKWAPTLGNINFKLNLSNATEVGEYNTNGTAGTSTDNTKDVFKLTLTGN